VSKIKIEKNVSKIKIEKNVSKIKIENYYIIFKGCKL
jgi:hypothetical protein